MSYVKRIWQPLTIVLLATLCCSFLLVLRPSVVRYIDYRIFDTLVAGVPSNGPSNQTVILDIDELSLAKVGRWPWSRNVLANLVEKLHSANASVVALDIMFPEPDASPASDQRLAAALAKGPSVIGFEFVFDSSRNQATECRVPPKPLVSEDVLPASQTGILLSEASAVICDVPILESHVTRTGFLNALGDRDSMVRRLPLLIAYRGAIYPSFALAAAVSTSNQDSVVLVGGAQAQLWLQLNGRRISLKDGPDLLLRYRRSGQPIPRYSAANLLDGKVPSEAFAGKIVVIGSSARGIGASLATSLDESFPMVDVAATAIDNLVAGDYFYEPGWGPTFEVASVFVASAVTVWLLFAFSPFVALGSGLGLAGCIVVVSQAIILIKGAFISPQPAIWACMGSMAIYAIRVVFMEGRLARRNQADLAVANQFITSALGAMTAVRDIETGQHVVRIQGYLRSLCQVMSARPRFAEFLTPQMMSLMVQLAPIHDIGKVGVPDHILRKPGTLTCDEFTQMKSHVTLGKKILQEARQNSGLDNELFFKTATDIVYSHHERWDGSGYPLGLKREAIPIPGRLLAVADVYDALTSKRHYKPELLHAEAVDEIRAGAGSHFDPEIVVGFLQVQDDWRIMAESHRDDPGLAASAT